MVLSFMRSIFASTSTEPAQSQNQLVSLPSGRLDLVRLTANNKTRRECIYLVADLRIRATSFPFHFQLVASRVLLEDDELPDDDYDIEKTFLIDQTIQFTSYPSIDEGGSTPSTTLGWIDRSLDHSTDRYEFVVDSSHPSCSGEKVQDFEEIVCRCVWERIHLEDSAQAPQEELDALRLINQPAVPLASESEPPLFRASDSEPEESDPDTLQETLSGDESSDRPDSEVESDDQSDPNPDEDASDDESADEVADQLTDQLRGTRLNDPTTPASDRSATQNSPHVFSPSSRKASLTPSPNYKGKASVHHPVTRAPSSNRSVAQGSSNVISPPSARNAPATPSSSIKGKTKADHPTSTVGSSASPHAASPPISTDSSQLAGSSASARGTKFGTTSTSEQTTGINTSNPSDVAKPDSQSPVQTEPVTIHSDSAKQNQSTHNDMICSWIEICDLYLFDPSADFQFVCKDRGVVASLWTPGPGTTNQQACWLTVLESENENGSEERMTWISMNLDKGQVFQFSGGAFTFNYTYEPEDGSEPSIYTWCCRFPDDEVSKERYENAKEAFGRAFYDRDNGVGSWDALQADTKYWNRQACGVLVEQNEDIEMAYDEEEETDEVAAQDSDEASDDVETQEEDTEAQKFRGAKSKKHGLNRSKGPKNSGLAVGYKEDMSFVLRGDIVGVFQNRVDGNKKLSFLGSTSVLTTPDGKRVLEPTEMMLHQQDSTLVFRDAKNPTSLYNLDLPTGKVVEEWKIDESAAVTNIVPRTKFAQMDPEATFIGTSHNSFYTIDPRLNGLKKVNNQNQTYKTPVNFSCAITTDTGDLAIGSTTGDIRLYSSNIGIKAKTHLNNVKDPTRGLDVSKDKRYMIATFPTYLVFFKLELEDAGKSTGFTGFQKSFPVARKPPGFRVELQPEHRAFIVQQGVPISFTRAKFNHGPDSLEKTVVTSIGPFIIAFNLRKLKLGQVDYTLKRYGEDVVAGGFKWSSDKEIVVTMESDVIIENRSKLARPDRHSLAGRSLPRNSAAQGGGIVQEWQ